MSCPMGKTEGIDPFVRDNLLKVGGVMLRIYKVLERKRLFISDLVVLKLFFNILSVNFSNFSRYYPTKFDKHKY